MILKMTEIYYLSNTKFIQKLTLRNAYTLLTHSAINLAVNVKFNIRGCDEYCLSSFSSQYSFLRI